MHGTFCWTVPLTGFSNISTEWDEEAVLIWAGYTVLPRLGLEDPRDG